MSEMNCPEDPHALLPLLRALRQDGYDVASSRSLVRLLGQIRGCGAADSAPAEVLVLDAVDSAAASVALLEAIRRTDWALPVVAICKPGDRDVHDASARLGIDFCVDASAGVEAVRDAVARVAPAVFDVAS